MLRRRPERVLIALSGVVLVTVLGYKVIPVNATTVGFAYLLVVLVVASAWGFLEAALDGALPPTLTCQDLSRKRSSFSSKSNRRKRIKHSGCRFYSFELE
jgi:hypothetical protein